MTWKKPAALVFGGSDPFIGLKSAFNFLESKRCVEQCEADAMFARRHLDPSPAHTA